MIRHAEAGDIEEIHEVAMESWKDAYSDIIPEKIIEEIVDDWYSEEDLVQQVEDPIFFVAEQDGNIVGFVHASVEDEEAQLHRIYLRPESQGRGIGSSLYNRVEEEIREKGGESVRLEVLSENEKGLNFYLHQGFKEVKEEVVELNTEEVRQKTLEKQL